MSAPKTIRNGKLVGFTNVDNIPDHAVLLQVLIHREAAEKLVEHYTRKGITLTEAISRAVDLYLLLSKAWDKGQRVITENRRGSKQREVFFDG